MMLRQAAVLTPGWARRGSIINLQSGRDHRSSATRMDPSMGKDGVAMVGDDAPVTAWAESVHSRVLIHSSFNIMPSGIPDVRAR